METVFPPEYGQMCRVWREVRLTRGNPSRHNDINWGLRRTRVRPDRPRRNSNRRQFLIKPTPKQSEGSNFAKPGTKPRIRQLSCPLKSATFPICNGRKIFLSLFVIYSLRTQIGDNSASQSAEVSDASLSNTQCKEGQIAKIVIRKMEEYMKNKVNTWQ